MLQDKSGIQFLNELGLLNNILSAYNEYITNKSVTSSSEKTNIELNGDFENINFMIQYNNLDEIKTVFRTLENFLNSILNKIIAH